MEIDTAVRRLLLTKSAVTGYVQTKVFKNELLEHVDGTAGRAVVVRKAVGWAPPDRTQSSEYPTLVIECWADVDRDPQTREKTVDNAVDKAYALYRAVDPFLHRIRDEVWGAGGTDPGARVITSVRAGEPRHFLHSYSRGGYSVPMQDCAVVEISYNVHL